MDAIDQFIVNATTHKPHNVWPEGTKYLHEQVIPVLEARAKLPDAVAIFAVHAVRGRANFRNRRITVPSWAFSRHKKDILDYNRKNIEYIQWYLAHELAHIANWDEFKGDHDEHGPNFMRHLICICPPNATRFEVGYKPRNSQAAGISSIDANDL